MKGRKKEPTRLHAIKGTDRADRRNDAEPVPPDRAPRRPGWLDGRSRAGRLWKEISALLGEMGVMTAADEQLIALGADRLAEYIDCKAYVRKHGRTYSSAVTVVGEDGEERERVIFRPRPEVAMYQSAFKDVMKVLSEVGMTPSARARLKTTPEKNVDELEDFLSTRKGRSA